MQVTNLKKLSDWSHNVTCRGCHSELIIESSDLKHKDRVRYYVYVNVVDSQLYVTCPSCNYSTDVPKNVIPDSIFDAVVLRAQQAKPPQKEEGWFRWSYLFAALAAVAFIIVMCLVD